MEKGFKSSPRGYPLIVNAEIRWQSGQIVIQLFGNIHREIATIWAHLPGNKFLNYKRGPTLENCPAFQISVKSTQKPFSWIVIITNVTFQLSLQFYVKSNHMLTQDPFIWKTITTNVTFPIFRERVQPSKEAAAN